MKYFKYKYNGNMGDIWNLFSGLAHASEEELDDKTKRWDYRHTDEIINSAMNGNIDYEEFDLRLYEMKCCSSDSIINNRKRDKFLSIVDTSSVEDCRVEYGQISMNDDRLKSIQEEFEMLENDDEFEKYLCELYNIRDVYIVEKGIDPVEMFVNSLKGIPEAVNTMSKIVLDDIKLKDIVSVLCENSSHNLEARLCTV